MITVRAHEVVAVLGAGAWGSTIADLLARKDITVRLWDHSAEALDRLAQDRHPFGVPELRLHASIRLESNLSEALDGATVAVFVAPSQATRSVAAAVAAAMGSRQELLVTLASKGIDAESLKHLSQIVIEEIPDCHVGVISGPCIAREVAQGIPTSVVAAALERDHAVRIRDLFNTPTLRVYTQTDLLGVELAGALKNVIAIAAGMGDGLGFGANSKSALMTRGLAEIARLAMAMGAQHTTVYGLAGLGDLAVTCFSPLSRNRTFGEHLGRGLSPAEAREKIGMVVEGEPTARAALRLAAERNIQMPITEVVVKVCAGEWTPSQAVENLMQRELKQEFAR